ncbi:MAG: cell cycle transcriptional regulator TrcR [Pseudomonadota bacterium]
MNRTPLMPKATAVWLVDNTSLTFEQIAEFCQLHVLEVKGIADGDVAQGIKGMDPISSSQLSRDEIHRAEQDTSHRLQLLEPKVEVPEVKTKRGPRYTPVSRRQDRPNAILWLLKSHPELKDSQIMRLVGTTKPTIQAIKERTHWNSPNLIAQDPVTLGLCSQIDLDAAVKRAAARIEREQKKAGKTAEKTGTLIPTEETIGLSETESGEAGETGDTEPSVTFDLPQSSDNDMAASLAQEARDAMAAPEQEEEAPDADSVFAKLKDLKVEGDEPEKPAD